MNEPFQPGRNPREYIRKHKERGPKRFTYTYADIAQVAGITIGALKQRVSRGKLDLSNLDSVVRYLVSIEIEKRVAPVG